jgi:hypothetical protein
MTLDERLQRFVGTWEPSLARVFLQYDRLLREKSRRPPSAWLAGQQRDGAGEVSPEFLDIVLWGQTSLFYAVRLQDDLLDGEFSRSTLALAPLLFLTEADRAFSSIIDSNAGFWEHYRLALETTVAGIVRVAAMQRDLAARADELLQVYGCVDAVFSVGASAVCERMGTADTIPRIKEFVSELGKVLLTLDDVEDIEEDLADGRLNYPARILLGRGIPVETDPALLATIWRLDARAGGFDEVMRTLLGCLGRAADAINPLELQAAMDLIETTKAAVLNIRDVA